MSFPCVCSIESKNTNFNLFLHICLDSAMAIAQCKTMFKKTFNLTVLKAVNHPANSGGLQ